MASGGIVQNCTNKSGIQDWGICARVASGANSLINVAKPFSPFNSIQKRPEPQICPKFVPAIVFGGSVRGSKSCEEFVKNGNFRQILTNLGFGAFLNAVEGGKRLRNIQCLSPSSVAKGGMWQLSYGMNLT